MIYKINKDVEVNIEVGSKIKTLKGILPSEFDGKWIDITGVEVDGPYAHLEPGQQSAITPSIITEVL